MSETYTKLFSSITRSSVWLEDDQTLRVWVTMLALADRNGFVGASVGGLAATARVDRRKTEEALAKFLAPDPDSRSKDNDGRRIEVADRGWILLNYDRFRDMRDEEARKEYERNRKREARAKARGDVPDASALSRDVPSCPEKSALSAHAEAEASHKQKASQKESEIQTRAPAAPTRTQPPAVDRVPEFGARQMATVFVREYEAVQRSTPSMGGKHVDGLHAMVCRTAELQGVSPESLFLDTVRAWLSNPLSDRDRQSPYACFCQAWGSLTARGTAKPAEGSAETVASLQEAAQAAVARGDLAEVKRLNARRRELEDAADRGMRRGR
jgi:hypothetical protein